MSESKSLLCARCRGNLDDIMMSSSKGWICERCYRRGKMDKSSQQKLMDSLAEEQRKCIAQIIRSADIHGDYCWNGEDSVWQESASETLESLAAYFDNYDPSSALD